MKIINDYTKIKPIRDAFWQFSRSYDNWGSDYSVTQLIRAPREIMLTKRYAKLIDQMPFTHDKIEQLRKSFMGTAVHNGLEFYLRMFANKNPDSNYIMERRIWDRINDRKISGKFDILTLPKLSDYKTTSTWKRIMWDWSDFIAQLNIYNYLLYTVGKEVTELSIIAWYTDWLQEKLWKTQDYPKTAIEELIFDSDDIWSRSKQKHYIIDRIELMKNNEDKHDEDLDYCSVKEMWEKPTIYAVMRPGQKKAVRTSGLVTKKKAEVYIENAKQKDKDTFYIEKRSAERTKCENFCNAAPFCSQFREYMEEKDEQNKNES